MASGLVAKALRESEERFRLAQVAEHLRIGHGPGDLQGDPLGKAQVRLTVGILRLDPKMEDTDHPIAGEEGDQQVGKKAALDGHHYGDSRVTPGKFFGAEGLEDHRLSLGNDLPGHRPGERQRDACPPPGEIDSGEIGDAEPALRGLDQVDAEGVEGDELAGDGREAVVHLLDVRGGTDDPTDLSEDGLFGGQTFGAPTVLL
jgi:hypothetical protein